MMMLLFKGFQLFSFSKKFSKPLGIVEDAERDYRKELMPWSTERDFTFVNQIYIILYSGLISFFHYRVSQVGSSQEIVIIRCYNCPLNAPDC